MDISGKILRIVRGKGGVSGTQIAAALGMSRQAAHRHLGRLLDDGRLAREGRTRGAVYRLPIKRSGTAAASIRSFKRTYTIEGLQEDAVFSEMSLHLNLKRGLSSAAYRILNHAFTEMLNNAIEHSRSPACRVGVTLAARQLRAVIRDQGVGVFHSIASRFALRDENDAVGELLKGKATTMPGRHSGEGIFFTSKTCDLFALRSHRIELVVDTRKHDTVVNVRKPISGTEVTFLVGTTTRRELEAVFSAFAPEEYDFRFERSIVTVRFSARDYVSRSEAKRLLARLESFKEVVLDFTGVRSLGQGFADEIFRVFAAAHPHIILKRTNVDPTLETVIRHVVDNKK